MKNNHPLQAGFGRTDITPALGVRLGGYGVKERPAEQILDRLHATAMVVRKGDLLAAVVNLDWICIEEDITAREKTKSDWAALTKLVGAQPRLEQVAADLVQHFEIRTATLEGKAMIVCMSRDICAALYNAIIAP